MSDIALQRNLAPKRKSCLISRRFLGFSAGDKNGVDSMPDARIVRSRGAHSGLWSYRETSVGEEEGEYGEYEYVSSNQAAESSHAHTESALLEQPLGEAALGQEGAGLSPIVPLCETGAEGPCAQSRWCACSLDVALVLCSRRCYPHQKIER